MALHLSGWYTANGTYEVILPAAGYGNYVFICDTNFTGSFDNVSVKKLSYNQTSVEFEISS